MILQRVRVEFSKGEELRYISHLDLMRAWHRVIRRAGLPLAYSEGFIPRPRLSLAAPLAVGVTGDRELLDLYFNRRIAPLTLLKAINAQLPVGLSAHTAEEVPTSLPSLQSLLQAVDYVIGGSTERPMSDLRQAIAKLLALPSLPWEHQREDETRHYDLRALIISLALQPRSDAEDPREFTITMRLRADAQGTGRPDQVMTALGYPEDWTFIHRTRIILERQEP